MELALFTSSPALIGIFKSKYLDIPPDDETVSTEALIAHRPMQAVCHRLTMSPVSVIAHTVPHKYSHFAYLRDGNTLNYVFEISEGGGLAEIDSLLRSWCIEETSS